MRELKKMLIPMPKYISDSKEKVNISSFGGVQVINYANGILPREGEKILKEKFVSLGEKFEHGNFKIIIRVDKDNEKFRSIESDEAYLIEVKEDCVDLCGADEKGAFYAAITLCQMLYSDSEDVYVCKADILDYPDFKSRGHYLECRYGSEFMTQEDYFSFIDDMAKVKANQLTIGVYGCWSRQYDDRKAEYLYVPIKKFPHIKTEKNIKYYSVKEKKLIHHDNLLPKMFEEDFLSDVISYGKKRNVKIKPLFNSLGHNTLLPSVFPEISSVNENGESSGFGFCTSNEKTYEILFGIYDEIIDRYLLPNEVFEFHIGMDEVTKGYICHCEKCNGKEHKELMIKHILRLCKYLKSRGIRKIYIYHDMLYNEFNIVNEELKRLFVEEGIYENVVLDWWSYDDPKHLFWDKKDGVNSIFHSIIKPFTGYHNWSIPGENNENVRACAALAKKLSFEGIEAYGSFERCYDKNYLTVADVAWNADNVENSDDFNERYAYKYYPDDVTKALEAFNALSDIMKDETGENYMNRICFKFDYYFYSYHKAKKTYPQNFPGDAFKLICENESEYIGYFKWLFEKSSLALAFFKNSDCRDDINKVWYLTALQYYTMSDEYLTVYSLWKRYSEGKCDVSEIVNVLERLIEQREEIMLLAENVRISATNYMYLRNMSVFRQYLIDLKNYFENETNENETLKFDICDLRYLLSDNFKFLQ